MARFPQLMIILFIAAVPFLSSCEREDNRKGLIAKHWVYESIILNGEEQAAAEMGSPEIIFNTEGHYSLEYGYNKETGKWQLSGDTLLINPNDSANRQQLFIKDLSNDKMELKAIPKRGEGDLSLHIVMVPKEKKDGE